MEPHTEPRSLYEQIGGMPMVEAIVELFYLKAMEVDSIRPLFEWTHMHQLWAKPKAFLAQVLGGPVAFAGEAWEEILSQIRSYAPTAVQAARVIELLNETLQELGIQEDLVAAIALQAALTQQEVGGTAT